MNSTSKKILVVDDNIEMLRIIDKELKKVGFEVFTAGDGKECLKIVFQDRPDLVILDIMMPMIHGYSVCQKIKSNEELKSIKVLMLSAKSYPRDITMAEELGADGYITKPFRPDILIEKVKELLGL